MNLGSDISILACCENRPDHHWMAYSLWYSVRHNLPRAEFVLACKRDLYPQQLFNWAYRLRIKFFFHAPEDCPEKVARSNKIFSRPNVIRLDRPSHAALDGYISPAVNSIASGQEGTFYSYHPSDFNFSPESAEPFNATDRLIVTGQTIYHRRLISLWAKMGNLFSSL